ncbi:anti-sigma factor family protein [Flavisphingomonas formosensis]|uniref:anti-sigma factor family protein n=1 Tax=Flavisphingomonas formosensis TaxID=861534 RepID=UPI0012F8136F|nr:anti-sigma factor [Sphingomonas formosensis]
MQPVSEIELQAYVDGELEGTRAVQIEDHLARHPEAAARVMADLRDAHALRLMAPRFELRPGHRQAAGRLARGLGQRSLLKRVRMPALAAAAAIALSFFTLNGNPRLGRGGWAAAAPSYVEDALQSHRTTQLRAEMASQIESPVVNANEILRTARIKVPRLPPKWRVMDAQIFPSDEGPALQISIETEDRRLLSMFAVRSPIEAPPEPVVVEREGETVAYWRKGDQAFAMIGKGTPAEIDRLAEDVDDGKS